MAIVNGYCTAAEVKAQLSIGDSNDDAVLEDAIETASRHIDKICGRRFWEATSATYTFTAEYPDVLYLPDFSTITAIATDETGGRTYATTWSPSDYDLEPNGGILDELTGWPYTRIIARSDSASGARIFPTTRNGVQITGKRGWLAVPDDVKTACELLAIRIFKRRETPFGVVGSPETGVASLPAQDPDVKRLLAPYRRTYIGAI